ncbi:unnamed protein product [Brassica rapa]|uniref:Uncharacterized protein n=1 Tax=Brassica campestris TaxID=3711 RepID=A0A8D9GYK5_BRACM|nr:unnamed protein product [Brassica rapa]
MANFREASKRWGKRWSKHGASGRELMDQVTGRSRWIAMEQITESVKREIAKSIAAVQALTWEPIGYRTCDVVRNGENEMESNIVSDRGIEMKSVTEKSSIDTKQVNKMEHFYISSGQICLNKFSYDQN